MTDSWSEEKKREFGLAYADQGWNVDISLPLEERKRATDAEVNRLRQWCKDNGYADAVTPEPNSTSEALELHNRLPKLVRAALHAETLRLLAERRELRGEHTMKDFNVDNWPRKKKIEFSSAYLEQAA
jgi:hypothetical protein